MSTLMQAWNQEGRTHNGMKTNLTSESANLDLFFLAGASRGKDITNLFIQAANENLDLAGRILLWLRDVRGGAGEREQFRNILHEIAERDVEMTRKLLAIVPEVGRWDDVLVLHDTPAWPEAVALVAKALYNGNSLCAKWMPRKGEIAVKLRQGIGWTPKQYRKTLVNLTNVVETKMCEGKWTEIEYSHVPSQAASIYQKAFYRHDEEGYSKYIDSLKKGETKINASAIFPHDIVKACLGRGNREVAAEQWKALPDYMKGAEEQILPVCDVSGSMTGTYGSNSSVRPLDVSISLGLYIAERNQGVFKDVVCTFSEKPSLVQLKTDKLYDRINELNRINWGMSTNLLGTFKTILEKAKKHNVPESEMPTMILIISDMEFNRCVHYDDNAIQGIHRQYEEKGYKLPKVVFWNVNGRQGNVPVQINEKGTALVSGFSPAILTALLSNPSSFTPEGIMLAAVGKERYNWDK